MKTIAQTLYAVGKIEKAIGVRGEVIVRPMTDERNRFKNLTRVFLGRTERSVVETAIQYVDVRGRGVRLKLRDIRNRTEAEEVAGFLLFVEESDRIRLPRGTFFIHDILGVRVVDDKGNGVGVVKDVMRLPAQDVYVIDTGGNEIMVPAVKEFIREIDIARKLMRVRLIDGMRET